MTALAARLSCFIDRLLRHDEVDAPIEQSLGGLLNQKKGNKKSAPATQPK